MFRKRKKSPVFKKRRSLKPLIFTVIGTILLIALVVGGGIAYVYLSEPDETNQNQQQFDQDRYGEPSLEAGEPDPNASVGVSVQMLSSPVEPGSNATYGVRTLRGAECEISVEYDEEKSRDSGLVPKTSDRFGMVSWTWTVEETVPEGEWPIEVICNWNEQSGMVQSDIEVSYGANLEE